MCLLNVNCASAKKKILIFSILFLCCTGSCHSKKKFFFVHFPFVHSTVDTRFFFLHDFWKTIFVCHFVEK